VTRCAQNLNAWYRTEAIKTVAFLIFIKGFRARYASSSPIWQEVVSRLGRPGFPWFI
jgi:hypothetical protein